MTRKHPIRNGLVLRRVLTLGISLSSVTLARAWLKSSMRSRCDFFAIFANSCRSRSRFLPNAFRSASVKLSSTSGSCAVVVLEFGAGGLSSAVELSCFGLDLFFLGFFLSPLNDSAPPVKDEEGFVVDIVSLSGRMEQSTTVLNGEHRWLVKH